MCELKFQDTVVLFGAIEAKPDMETTSGAESKTAKTIEAVTWIMLGQEAEQKAMYFGNAGNDAYVSIVNRPFGATADIL